MTVIVDIETNDVIAVDVTIGDVSEYGFTRVVDANGINYDCENFSIVETDQNVVKPARYVNGVFVSTFVEPVPDTISMRQCRLQLLSTPLGDSTGYATVNAAIATMGEAAQIDWEYAADVQRTFPLVVAMQQMFGWDDSQMDDFFREAAKL